MSYKVKLAVLGGVAAVAAGFAIPQVFSADVTGLKVMGFKSVTDAADTSIDINVPHKALYSVRLASVESGAGVTGLRGQMYYEQADACDAVTSEHRFTIEYQYPERSPVINKSHYVSWEAKDHNLFYFNSDRSENGQLTEQLRGAVNRSGKGETLVEYGRPEGLSFNLPSGYVLPLQHTSEVIRHAREGKNFYNTVLFDGTDSDGPAELNTFIGKKLTAEEIAQLAGNDAKNDKKIDASLLAPEAWHVRMSFFPLMAERGSDMAPAYEMNLILHANGVVSKAVVEYQNFTVEQKLQALEKLPEKKCS